MESIGVSIGVVGMVLAIGLIVFVISMDRIAGHLSGIRTSLEEIAKKVKEDKENEWNSI